MQTLPSSTVPAGPLPTSAASLLPPAEERALSTVEKGLAAAATLSATHCLSVPQWLFLSLLSSSFFFFF